MTYQEIIEKGIANLRQKNVLRYYRRFMGDGGTESGNTAQFNRLFFSRFGLKTRLIDTQFATTEATLFNQRMKTPIMAAALSQMNDITPHPLPAIATGVKEAGSIMWVGKSSPTQLSMILETQVPTVAIIKPFRDDRIIFKKIEEATKKGAIALGIDIDYILGGKLEDHLLSPKAMAPKTLNQLKSYRKACPLPFILKGILSEEDAKKAEEIGADCLVLSNHGGNVFDFAAHPLEVLPSIKASVNKRMIFVVDSGIRRGTDVLKALALGADLVCIGYPLAVALAANGSEGVRDLIIAMTEELQRVMTLTGCHRISEINTSVLVRR